MILDENGAMRVGVFSQDGQATLINYSLLFANSYWLLKDYLDEVESDIAAMLKADRQPGIVERGVQKRIS